MSDCSTLNAILTQESSKIMFIGSTVFLILSLSGSFRMLFTCRKAKDEFTFAKLTFFIALWDIIFNISVYVNLYLKAGPICDAFQATELISVSLSLSYLLVVSISCLCSTRSQQNFFIANYTRGIYWLYIITIAHGLGGLYFNLAGDTTSPLYFFYTVSLLLVLALVIFYCNIRLIYVIRKNYFELRDKTPALLSVGLFLLFGSTCGCLFYNFFNEPSQYVWIATVWLEEITGFGNYIISFNRIKTGIDTMEFTKRMSMIAEVQFETEADLSESLNSIKSLE